MSTITNPQAPSGDSPGWNYLSLGPYSGDSLRRHKERCHICRHPQREEIEQDFLDWTSPREIAETYGIASYRAIYRHATAVGLFDRRRANIQRATDRIIERIDETHMTASAIVAAIRITLNEERKWLDYVHRLTYQDIRGEKIPGPPLPDRLHRPIPQEYLVGLAPEEIQSIRQPQPPQKSPAGPPAPEKSNVNPPAPEQSVRETAPVKPADSSLVASAARKSAGAAESEPPKPAPGKSSSAPAPKPSGPAQIESLAKHGSDNVPGQVAGLPWPWPVKKIQFARRWRFNRDG